MKKITPIFISLFLLFLGCNVSSTVEFSGKRSSIDVDMTKFSTFDTVEAEDIFTIDISQGNETSIQISADENLIPYIGIEQVGGTLRMFFQKNLLYYYNYSATATIILPDLKGLKLSNDRYSGNRATIRGFNLDHNITIYSDSYSNVTVDINATEIIIQELKNSSHLKLTGKADTLTGHIGYGSTLNFVDFSCKNANLDLNQTGAIVQGKLVADENISIIMNNQSRLPSLGLELNATHAHFDIDNNSILAIKGTFNSLSGDIDNLSQLTLMDIHASTGFFTIENSSKIEGSAVFDTNVTATLQTSSTLDINGTGSGALFLTAKTSSHGLLEDFPVSQASVTLETGSDAWINTTGIINYNITGSSTLKYPNTASLGGVKDSSSQLLLQEE